MLEKTNEYSNIPVYMTLFIMRSHWKSNIEAGIRNEKIQTKIVSFDQYYQIDLTSSLANTSRS